MPPCYSVALYWSRGFGPGRFPMTEAWTFTNRPLRKVVKATPMAGRGGLMGGDTSRRRLWWDLVLDCDHEVQRDMRYRPLSDGEHPILGANRPVADRLPPPKRARCDDCDQRNTPAKSAQ